MKKVGSFICQKNYVPETVLSTGESSEQADENLSLPWSLHCKGKLTMYFMKCQGEK